jgi:hypothetical protein
MPKTLDPKSPAAVNSHLRAELKRFTDRFGAEAGIRFFQQGLSLEEAAAEHRRTALVHVGNGQFESIDRAAIRFGSSAIAAFAAGIKFAGR